MNKICTKFRNFLVKKYRRLRKTIALQLIDRMGKSYEKRKKENIEPVVHFDFKKIKKVVHLIKKSYI